MAQKPSGSGFRCSKCSIILLTEKGLKIHESICTGKREKQLLSRTTAPSPDTINERVNSKVIASETNSNNLKAPPVQFQLNKPADKLLNHKNPLKRDILSIEPKVLSGFEKKQKHDDKSIEPKVQSVSEKKTKYDDEGDIEMEEDFFIDLNLPPEELEEKVVKKSSKPLKKNIDEDVSDGAEDIVPPQPYNPDVDLQERDKLAFDDFVSVSNDDKEDDRSMALPYICTGKPPWQNQRGYSDDMWGLHHEILDFVHFISPNEAEKKMRVMVTERLKSHILGLWPGIGFNVFGSVNTGLYLPSSDIDVVLIGNFKNLRGPMYSLAAALRKTKKYNDVQVISNAKVPIVKMVDVESNYSIDISFNVSNGLKNTDLIKEYLQRYHQLKPLVIVLKQYLLQRGLNEPYTGGIGSYALILMIVNFLQLTGITVTKDHWTPSSETHH
jgi:predicted nucleotidyltransferase